MSDLIVSNADTLRIPICQAAALPVSGVSVSEWAEARVERHLTGGEAVAAGVALQLLLAVLAVKVIFAGRAQVHCRKKRKTIGMCGSLGRIKATAPVGRGRGLTYGTRWRAGARGC